ncbi:MAG: Mur ligase family protein [Candidatus Gottesmanbacteria bacterium]
MKQILYIIACVSGLLTSFISRFLGYGAGATWPGEIALRIYPRILEKLTKRIKNGIIIVAGTNGKTTTSGMITSIIRHAGNSVLHNTSGANLINGIVSSFFVSWKKVDWAVFEVDENALPKLLSFINPTAIVLLNLFRDQLDRYGEVDTIASSWRLPLLSLDEKTTVLANGDDPTIVAVTEKLHSRAVYFGLENPKLYLSKMQHATDAIYCPICGTRLTFGGVYFSHLGKWACGSCGFTHPDILIDAADYESSLEGVYNIYNTLAAASVGEVLGIDKGEIQQSLDEFQPVFGRMETVQYYGKTIRILLSKNPTGFNESLRTVLSSSQKGPILVLLNDRVPDGKDVSWIWDVDFEQLSGFPYSIIISGDRAYDMAVRIAYIEKKKRQLDVQVLEGFESAIKTTVDVAKENEIVWVLATYSAMLDARKILTGKRIL